MNPSEPPDPKPRRKSPAGAPSTDLVLSCHRGTSADVFPEILKLYVAPGAAVLDTTYGKGVFWRNVPQGLYALTPSDLSTGTDARHLPNADGSADCIVFDPPWMPTSGGNTHTSTSEISAFQAYYRNNERLDARGSYREGVLALYFEAAVEAFRVLKTEGLYVVKCQDEVHANKQWLTHVDLILGLQARGFVVEDLFVMMRTNRPGVSRMLKQHHARKNHSYFIVMRKPKPARRPRGLDAAASDPHPVV